MFRAAVVVCYSSVLTRRERVVYEHIQYDVDDPVAVITLNRPEALNAITGRMQAELRHALAAAEADSSVVGIVLTGAGRGFCAGADIGGLQAQAGNSGGGGAAEAHSRWPDKGVVDGQGRGLPSEESS